VSDQKVIESKIGVLQEVAQGKKHAMEQCVTKYGGLVWSIARRYTKDHSSAEDIVQETFTDLWKSAHRFNPATAAETTFVGMLARRRAIDYVRKESRQPLLEPLPEAESLPHASPETSPALRCESQDVREALKQLPQETQQIFSLHFDEGMTHSEISKKIGLPLGTVKTRLRRGLIEVRNILRQAESAQPSFSSNR
jgi:RNA polymerase sigma-70 factor (ECF subfamily)